MSGVPLAVAFSVLIRCGRPRRGRRATTCATGRSPIHGITALLVADADADVTTAAAQRMQHLVDGAWAPDRDHRGAGTVLAIAPRCACTYSPGSARPCCCFLAGGRRRPHTPPPSRRYHRRDATVAAIGVSFTVDTVVSCLACRVRDVRRTKLAIAPMVTSGCLKVLPGAALLLIAIGFTLGTQFRMRHAARHGGRRTAIYQCSTAAARRLMVGIVVSAALSASPRAPRRPACIAASESIGSA